jgi:hypothetical protein
MTRHGHKDATTDSETIQGWWAETPKANIGIPTGPESGILVVDLDGQEGIEAFAKLEAENGPLPKTPTVRTGGDGKHLYFNCPSGVEVRNKTKLQGLAIDVRGDGGYVIAAGSNHPEGRYEWEIPPDEAPLAEAPEWLMKFVTDRASPAIDHATTDNEALFDEITGEPDLRTAPGAPEGKRHETACRLIGRALGRGIDPKEVLKDALAWAKRCDPPFEEDEVRRIWSDLLVKDVAKFAHLAQEERPWPEPDDAMFHGLAGEIVRAIEPSTEADPVAILVHLLVFFGNVIGRHAYFIADGIKHFTNLFAVVVGRTSKGRKGTSESWVREFFQWVDQKWASQRIQSGSSSGEGLIWAVRDPIEKTEPIKERGTGKIIEYQKIIADPGIEDKRLLVREPEFASVLRVMKREGNTLTTTIRDSWDTGDLRTMTKNSPARATGAHISIIGHITQEELKQSMDYVEGFNGFANRFLWICAERSKLLPEGGALVDLKGYIDRMIGAVTFASQAGQMHRDDEARKLWSEIYAELAKEHAGLLGAVTSRSEAQVLRLSMMYALLDGSVIIRPEHLRAARALWQYVVDSASYIFGRSTGDTLADRLLKIIRSRPCTLKNLHAETGRHLSSDQMRGALERLRRLGLIKRDSIKTGGRNAELWSVV